MKREKERAEGGRENKEKIKRNKKFANFSYFQTNNDL